MSHTVLWKRLLIWGVCLWGILFALPNVFYPQVERHNDAAAILADAGSLPPPLATDLSGWPNWLPSSLVNLGLDLRGGAHLLAEEVRVGLEHLNGGSGRWEGGGKEVGRRGGDLGSHLEHHVVLDVVEEVEHPLAQAIRRTEVFRGGQGFGRLLGEP